MNFIHLVELAKKQIELNKEKYISKYGIVPTFKAGIHFGEIIITEVGKSKHEIAYHGDTINTASRICSLCSEYNKKLLVSQELIDIIPNIENEFILVPMGSLKLNYLVKWK